MAQGNIKMEPKNEFIIDDQPKQMVVMDFARPIRDGYCATGAILESAIYQDVNVDCESEETLLHETLKVGRELVNQNINIGNESTKSAAQIISSMGAGQRYGEWIDKYDLDPVKSACCSYNDFTILFCELFLHISIIVIVKDSKKELKPLYNGCGIYPQCIYIFYEAKSQSYKPICFNRVH